MNDHQKEHHELSDHGRARRDAMLAELSSRVPRAARVRRIRSGVAAGAALLAIASLSVLIAPRSQPAPTPVAINQQPTEPVSVPPRIQIVQTEPGIVTRLSAATDSAASRIEQINDDELIFVLAEMGRPAGIIRTPNRTWLTAAVTDDELKPDPTNTSNSG